ncbi:MAG: hypothetical protein IT379_27135, partial [Deltaproteobacteria bacterium]|nr:hypothetical protein [Deltaproteobacteria bacterium]
GAADLGAPSDAAFTDSEPLDAAADSGAADLGAPSDAAADAGPDSGTADAELPCPCPDDGFDCTEERCTDAGACEHAIVAGRCLISGRCYAGGEWQAPDNPCSQCGVASSTDWTQATGQCGSSPTRICCDGLCQPPPCNVCGEPSCLPGP